MNKKWFSLLLAFFFIFSTQIPAFADGGTVSLYNAGADFKRYKISGTGWSNYQVDQYSNGGYKSKTMYKRTSSPQMHVVKCNGGVTFRFYNYNNELVNSQSVTVSGISNEIAACNPPQPKPEPVVKRPPAPAKVTLPKPKPNVVVKPPTVTKPPEIDDFVDEKPEFTSVTIKTNITKTGDYPVSISLYDYNGGPIRNIPLKNGTETYRIGTDAPFASFKIFVDSPEECADINSCIYFTENDWKWASDEQYYDVRYKSLDISCPNDNYGDLMIRQQAYNDNGAVTAEGGTQQNVSSSNEKYIEKDGYITWDFTVGGREEFPPSKIWIDFTGTGCYLKGYTTDEKTVQYSESNPYKPIPEMPEFEIESITAETTSPLIESVDFSLDEEPEAPGGCDALCQLFSCPGWGEYMGKMEEIKNAIPPAPDWQSVSETFRDTIAPKLKEDIQDVLGEAPEPPAAPEAPAAPPLPPDLDDGGLEAPTGEEAPGLGESTFDYEDIKEGAPEIPIREDPTDGFTIDNPVDMLPSQEEFMQNLPNEGSAPLPANPKEEENPAPFPKDEGATAPMPGDEGATAPTPGDTGDSAPLPDKDGSTAPLPSQGNNNVPVPGQDGSTAPLPGR
ncbi:hypothetical protein V4V35_25400 [Bacillus infantis]|uniref:hypothetical protein n=1 Tax=Bacillus infantis TaxID=324767 RepID=UPI002FBEEFD9